jgi:hypothetical protein
MASRPAHSSAVWPRPLRPAAVLAPLVFLAACSSTASPGAGPTDASAESTAVMSSDAGADSGEVSMPFSISSFPGGQGKFFLVAVSVNGVPFNVLLDTGSSGLRVFSAATLGTPTGEDVPDDFGSGWLCGPTETAVVGFGGLTTPGPIAFQRVESCDGGEGLMGELASVGIQGIFGASLRADAPQDIYSPFEQLGSPLSSGFIIRTGGYSSTKGAITFGVSSDTLSGFQPIALAPDPGRDSGPPAWMDTPSVCFLVNGAQTNPPCSSTYFDTGSNFAIIQDTAPVPGGLSSSGMLIPGTTFEAKAPGPTGPDAGSPFDLAFTVGSSPITSLDEVEITQQSENNLGIEVFFRFDVAFDVTKGRLAFREQGM